MTARLGTRQRELLDGLCRESPQRLPMAAAYQAETLVRRGLAERIALMGRGEYPQLGYRVTQAGREAADGDR